jgi:hypothetical protein
MTAFSGPAFAAKVVGYGPFTCSQVNGSLRYQPPMRFGSAVSNTTVDFKLVATGCTVAGNVTTLSQVTMKGKVSVATNDCEGLLETQSLNPLTPLKTTYIASPRIESSSGYFYATVPDGTGPDAVMDAYGFQYGGSFSGGPPFTAMLDSGPGSAVGAACSSARGLKSLPIVSGTLESF